jgi:hypothetical protein
MNPFHDAHDLMPEEIANKIPGLYETENQSDPIALVRLFTPDSSWIFFITEYDPHEHLCFGLVDGLETELGYFSLAEIESVRGPYGLPVERDLHFTPTPLSALHLELDRGR